MALGADVRLGRRQHAAQSISELLHGALWFIGAHVWHVRV